jgi:hypothetical protein
MSTRISGTAVVTGGAGAIDSLVMLDLWLDNYASAWPCG